MNKRYTWAWRIWTAAGLLVEFLAVRDKRKGDTLSEHVWGLVRIPVVWWTAAGLLVWAAIHFLGRGRWDDFFIPKEKATA